MTGSAKTPGVELPADFGFVEEHAVLRQEARRFLAERFPIAEVRRLADTQTDLDPGVWKELAQLGWLGVLLPERFGGSALGALPWALLLEEAGRHLLAGPLLGTVLASLLIERAGDDAQRERWLPALVAGDRVAAPAWIEAGGRYAAERLETCAEESGSGYSLSGDKCHVVGAPGAELLVVPARVTPNEVACFVVESGSIRSRDRAGEGRRPDPAHGSRAPARRPGRAQRAIVG